MTDIQRTENGFRLIQSNQVAPEGFEEHVTISLGDLLKVETRFEYIWQHVLVKGYLYALTAAPGTGKTAISVLMALSFQAGRPLHGRKVKKSKVLFLVGENPADFRLRIEQALKTHAIELDEVAEIVLTQRPFNLDEDDAKEKFLSELAGKHFDIVFIDTLPAHSSADDENDNVQQHRLAMAVRHIGESLGNPAIVALMHPVKNAGRDQLLPRGGSAFTGSIDGVLCLWKECATCPVELFPHASKYRGKHFDTMRFELQSVPTTEVDNFGDIVETVVAVEAAPESSTNGVSDQEYDQLKIDILRFIWELTEHAGEWIGVATSGTVNNNVLKKSYIAKPFYPALLKARHGDSAVQAAAFRAVDDLQRAGLLVLEDRYPGKYQTRDEKRNGGRKNGLWLTDAGKEVLL